MPSEEFAHEYDLNALTKLRPRGQRFEMQVTPRYRRHYETLEYEPYTALFLGRVLTRCSLFVDVGANYGFYTLLAGTEHPHLQILSLEPVPETFEILKKNVNAAGLTSVQLEQAAAADQDGEAYLQISMAADNCGFSPHPAAPPLRQARVRIARLDTFLADRVPCPALVKIDVEGHELRVLRGMSATLERFPDLSLLLELNPKMLRAAGTAPEDFILELDRLGFAAFLLDDECRRPYRLKPDSDWRTQLARLGYANVYCVRKQAALSVCFFSHTSNLAGAERSLLELVKELIADHGVVCSVTVPGEGPLVSELQKVGAACLKADYGWWATPPSTVPAPGALLTLQPQLEALMRNVLPVLRAIDPDFVWTQTMVIPWGAVASSVLKKPHVWSVCEYGELDHGLHFFAPFPKILEDISASSAWIYTCGRALGEKLFPEETGRKWQWLLRCLEIPDAPDDCRPTGIFEKPGVLRLGVFATLHESKGQEDALRAAASLVATGQKVELALAGHVSPVFRDKLNGIIAELGLQDYVRLPGFLADPFPLMRETDIVLVCSRHEAFGRVAPEAMLMAKPVIYAATGGGLEYMIDGRTGLSYVPGDSEDLACKIRLLANDAGRRQQLGAEAKTHAQGLFNRQNYGGEVYRKFCDLREKRVESACMPRLIEPLWRDAQASSSREQSLLENGVFDAHLAGSQLEAAGSGPQPKENDLKIDSKRSLKLEKFLAKQKRSFKKRRAESRDLLWKLGMRLRLTPRLRALRRERKLIRDSGLLDEAWYRHNYSKLLVSDRCDPALHYLLHGAAAGCDPNSLFDTRWYLERNAGVLSPGINPLVHYLVSGWKEGSQPSLEFDPRLYLEANPDVAAARMEPLAHYLCSGMKEARPLEPGTERAFSSEPDIDRRWPEPDVRLIAFYLPQFHQVPENDAWWGTGFTEWTNVKAGRPQFDEHYQPHVPHPAVGYYDLKDESVLERQAAMARRFGIHGFCFHHYWFGGKRLLEMPVERMLRTGKPDFPFCLCWANENWTRAWDGADDEILIAQNHSPEDDARFIRHLFPAFSDGRYIRVNGRPLLIVYRPLLLPEPAATFRCWREVCRAEGVGELFLVGAQTFDFTGPPLHGLDAAVEFPPNAVGQSPLPKGQFKGSIYDYRRLRTLMLARRTSNYRLFRGVMPSWDNTARRRKNGTVFTHSSPADYFLWLRHVVRNARSWQTSDERLVFINAWNEWAEGCHLEPDQRYGFQWLNATRRALLSDEEPTKTQPSFSASIIDSQKDVAPVLVIAHDACRAGAQHVLLTLLRTWDRFRPFPFKLILCADGPLREQFEALCPSLLLTKHTDPAQRNGALRAFLKPAPRSVYSNTVVNGRLLEELRWLGCPVITHVHELQRSIERWAPGEIMAATLRCSDHWIAVSEPVAENLVSRHHVAPNAISTVHEFIETGAARPESGIRELYRSEIRAKNGELVVLGCGTTDWRKGPDLFLETAAKARAAMAKLRFCWIGSRNEEQKRQLEQQVKMLKLGSSVIFLGEKENARAYFSAGDIFLLSSREDPFPLVALEAADAGLPIVCFANAGGMPGFVGDECGMVVPFEDTGAAAAAVAKLAANRDLRLRLGAEAMAKVARCHSAKPAAERIAQILKETRRAEFLAEVAPTSPPLVSVVVPNYNHAAYLPERLQSILDQEVQEIEILLLDDASSDSSRFILEEFARRDRRAQLLPSQANSGSTFKQWRKALGLCRGKYIWIAESDDSAAPGFLKAVLARMEQDSRLALAYTQSRMVDAQGRPLGLPLDWTSDISAQRWRDDYRCDGQAEIRTALLFKNTIPNASAVLFRNYPGIEHLVDDSMRLCADWLFWVRLCCRGAVAYTAQPLNYWRQNSSHARIRPPGVLEWQEGRAVIEEAAHLLELSDSETRQFLAAFRQKCDGWLRSSQPSSRIPSEVTK